MKVEYLKTFIKDSQRITDANLKVQLMEVIDKFKKAENLGELSNIKKMKGNPEAYRIRVGKYRLGFYYGGETLDLARFVKREDIYKLFP